MATIETDVLMTERLSPEIPILKSPSIPQCYSIYHRGYVIRYTIGSNYQYVLTSVPS